MNILGISEGFHDAAMCVIRDKTIIHASQSERYSGVKNDKWVHPSQWPVSDRNQPDIVAYYEKPFRKNLRRLWAGQSWENPRLKYDRSFSHHESHAAAGYYTAPFDNCNVLVIDAIGEWDTISIWEGSSTNGFMGLLMALKYYSSIDCYGFSFYDPGVKKHYFDEIKKYDMIAGHDFNNEKKIIFIIYYFVYNCCIYLQLFNRRRQQFFNSCTSISFTFRN